MKLEMIEIKTWFLRRHRDMACQILTVHVQKAWFSAGRDFHVFFTCSKTMVFEGLQIGFSHFFDPIIFFMCCIGCFDVIIIQGEMFEITIFTWIGFY